MKRVQWGSFNLTIHLIDDTVESEFYNSRLISVIFWQFDFENCEMVIDVDLELVMMY